MSIVVGQKFTARVGSEAYGQKDMGHVVWEAVRRTGRGWQFKAEDGCVQLWPASDMVPVDSPEMNIPAEKAEALIGRKYKLADGAFTYENPNGPIPEAYKGKVWVVKRIRNNDLDHIQVQVDGDITTWWTSQEFLLPAEESGLKFLADPGQLFVLPEDNKKHVEDLNKVFGAVRDLLDNLGYEEEFEGFCEGILPALNVKPTENVTQDFELDVFGNKFTVSALSLEDAQEKVANHLAESVSYYGKLEI